MNKLYINILISIFSGLSVFAQNNSTKKADKYFERFEYVNAAKNYAKIVEEGKANTYVYKRLADCYYNIFNTIEAEKWYAKALVYSRKPEVFYRYAQMLKANGKHEQSNIWMSKFSDIRPKDSRVLAFKANPNYLPKIINNGKKFNITRLEFNSEYSDFGGTLHNGKLYITSARNSANEIYGWNNEPFLDILEIPIRSDGTYGNPFLLEGEINTKYHEGIVSFSPDGNTMYFSRESFYDNQYNKSPSSRNKFGMLNLYKATKNSYGGWDNIKSLPFNSSKYNNDHPSVSRDGSTLYFSSDRPEGYGLNDIYKVKIKSNSTFGEPINLGPVVNTEGREMFPYLGYDDSLYFSSDGHLGLGGLDVFFTKEIDGKMATVRNIGIPLNSNADDFAFVINQSGEGYVSSNRMGGKGSDDIYAVKNLRPICDVLISAIVTDSKSGNFLSGTTIAILGDSNNALNAKSTNSSGKTEFFLECSSDTKLEFKRDGYESQRVHVLTTRNEEENVIVSLNPIDEIIAKDRIVLNPIYFGFNKSNITDQGAFELDKLIQLMTKYPDLEVAVTSHTDGIGSEAYNMGLSDRRAKTTVQYAISKGIDSTRLSGIGKGENEPIYNCGIKCTEEEHQKNRRSEFIIMSKESQEQ